MKIYKNPQKSLRKTYLFQGFQFVSKNVRSISSDVQIAGSKA
jgi:hypothetical protein